MQPSQMRTILVAESDSLMRSNLRVSLESLGYAVELARGGADALSYLRDSRGPINAVLLDVAPEDWNGLAVLREIREFHPELPVILLSGAAPPANIASAMDTRAAEFLPVPTDEDQLSSNANLPRHRERSRSIAMFQGTSPGMRKIHELVGRIGQSEAPVLIQGETGTGKEVIARELHGRSPRSAGPFRKINCAALPGELIESELFGYERGAFTGAVQKKTGMFEDADGGTLLLDEIGDMDFRLQSKLLHVLQDGSFFRIGGKEPIAVDVRVMAATHCDLEAGIANRTFRQDLYYRLNVINIHLPPLRDRQEDLPGLIEFLIGKHLKQGARVPPLTDAFQDALMRYHWPGNIRELENCIRRFLILGDPDTLARELRAKSNFSAGKSMGAVSIALTAIVDDKMQAERDAIMSALNTTCWNRRQAAALLQVDYHVLRSEMRKLGIGQLRERAGVGAPLSERESDAQCRFVPQSAPRGHKD